MVFKKKKKTEKCLYSDIRPYISFQISFTVVIVVGGKTF